MPAEMKHFITFFSPGALNWVVLLSSKFYLPGNMQMLVGQLRNRNFRGEELSNKRPGAIIFKRDKKSTPASVFFSLFPAQNSFSGTLSLHIRELSDALQGLLRQ